MNRAADYLDRTESAARHLLNGLDGYRAILRRAPVLVQCGGYASREEHDAAIDQWLETNESGLEARRFVEREYLAEHNALAALCGSLLQLSVMTVQLFSNNKEVPESVRDIIQPGKKAATFSLGREIRTVSIGLVIYAGRNQYNHFDEGTLREPNSAIFERLATCGGYGERIRDPAFDLQNESLRNYAPNIVGLLEWRGYDAYRADMESLLSI